MSPANVGPVPSFLSGTGKRYKYDYPGGLDFSPDSELHRSLVGMVCDYATASQSATSSRIAVWDDIYDTLSAYIAQDEDEETLKESDKRKPTSIVVPASYAALETLLTPLVSTFLREPYFRYEGTGPEDVKGAALLERVISIQCTKSKVGLALHTMLRDCLAYGVGAVTTTWERRFGKKTLLEPKGISWLNPGGVEEYKRTSGRGLIYEGNKLENIDIYLLLCDPNVPVDEVQRAEFVGWLKREGRMNLMRRETTEEGRIFNIKYLADISGSKTSRYYRSRAGESTEYITPYNSYQNPTDVIWMYIDLIPAERKLGKSEEPEKWIFGVAADQLLIAAQPVELDHDMFPVSICAPEYDGFTLMPPAKIEIVNGLQILYDFLINSFVKNVRKAVNDVLVADPKLIDILTLEDYMNEAGGVITLNEGAWGRGVNDAVKQLEVRDITQSNIPNAAFVGNLMKEILGATNPIMGIMERGGERRSATEARDAKLGALSRIEKTAKVISMQAMYDIAYLFASHQQQFGNSDIFVRLTGRMEEDLRAIYGDIEGVLTSPEDLVVEFDVLPHDGLSPNSDFVESWVEVFRIVSQNETLLQKFDIVRIFSQIATKMGARNLREFENKGQQGMLPNAEVLPDQEVREQVESGKIKRLPSRLKGAAV
jgi:hypothetical protein